MLYLATEKPTMIETEVAEELRILDGENQEKDTPLKDNEYKNGKTHNRCIVGVLLMKCFIIFGTLILLVIATSVALVYKAEESKTMEERHNASIECNSGWKKISNVCFLFAYDACSIGCTWDYAKLYCGGLGGRLAEPRNSSVLQSLITYGSEDKKIQRKTFWIGLINDNSSKEFKWISDNKKAEIEKQFWQKNEPSHDGDLVHMVKNTLLLNDRKSLGNKPICQKELDYNKSCENGWIQRGSFCYRFMENECKNKCNWKEAEKICIIHKSFLTEGPDFQFLRNMAHKMPKNINWWIGFYKYKDNFVAKTDNRYMNLTEHFAIQEPSPHEDENCLEMNFSQGYRLNNRRCDYSRWERSFQPLCQIVN